jgi:hypothetical protein
LRLQGGKQQMPDFEVNEGYVEAGRRRADSPLSSRGGDDRMPVDGYGNGTGDDAGAAPAPIVRPEGVRWEGMDAIEAMEALKEIEAFEVEAAEAIEGRRRKLPPETPFVRRTRHFATGHYSFAHARPTRRVGVRLIARRRRLARRACPYGWQVRVLGTPPRNRRRLWTMCHRSEQFPGSPS